MFKLFNIMAKKGIKVWLKRNKEGAVWGLVLFAILIIFPLMTADCVRVPSCGGGDFSSGINFGHFSNLVSPNDCVECDFGIFKPVYSVLKVLIANDIVGPFFFFIAIFTGGMGVFIVIALIFVVLGAFIDSIIKPSK